MIFEEQAKNGEVNVRGVSDSKERKQLLEQEKKERIIKNLNYEKVVKFIKYYFYFKGLNEEESYRKLINCIQEFSLKDFEFFVKSCDLLNGQKISNHAIANDFHMGHVWDVQRKRDRLITKVRKEAFKENGDRTSESKNQESEKEIV